MRCACVCDVCVLLFMYCVCAIATCMFLVWIKQQFILLGWMCENSLWFLLVTNKIYHRFFGLINVNLFHKMCWHFVRWILCANITFTISLAPKHGLLSWTKCCCKVDAHKQPVENVHFGRFPSRRPKYKCYLKITFEFWNVLHNVDSTIFTVNYHVAIQWDGAFQWSREWKTNPDSAYSIELVCISRTYWVSLKINVQNQIKIQLYLVWLWETSKRIRFQIFISWFYCMSSVLSAVLRY